MSSLKFMCIVNILYFMPQFMDSDFHDNSSVNSVYKRSSDWRRDI